MYISSLFYFVLAQVCDHLQPLRTENFRVTLRCIVSKTHNKRRLAARNTILFDRAVCLARPALTRRSWGLLWEARSQARRSRRGEEGFELFQYLLFRELNPGHDAGKWTYR